MESRVQKLLELPLRCSGDNRRCDFEDEPVVEDLGEFELRGSHRNAVRLGLLSGSGRMSVTRFFNHVSTAGPYDLRLACIAVKDPRMVFMGEPPWEGDPPEEDGSVGGSSGMTMTGGGCERQFTLFRLLDRGGRARSFSSFASSPRSLTSRFSVLIAV